MLYATDESLNSNPETNNTVYVNQIEFKFKNYKKNKKELAVQLQRDKFLTSSKNSAFNVNHSIKRQCHHLARKFPVNEYARMAELVRLGLFQPTWNSSNKQGSAPLVWVSLYWIGITV